MNRKHSNLIFVIAAICFSLGIAAGVLIPGATASQNEKPTYAVSTSGVRKLERGPGPNIKLLVDESNLAGTELEIGEIEFPSDYQPSPPHTHTSVEIFYVISGELGHTVNGEKHVIGPGMAGIVRPGDAVVHSVESDAPVKGLVIWTPTGEADRLVQLGVFKSTPIE